MASTSLLARLFFILSATFQVCGTLAADWSASHIYNPTWPPHAKFHTGQTISMAIVLAGLGLYLAFRPKAPAGSVSAISHIQLIQRQRDDVFLAMVVLDIYWVTQALAFFYPGTASCDVGFCSDLPFPGQLIPEAIGLGLNGLAYGAEIWAVRAGGDGRKGI